jgi:hypothetical protein
VVGLFGRRWREPLPGIVASVAVGGAFVASVVAPSASSAATPASV